MSDQIQLTVSGMTCEHCKRAVTEAVEQVPGVSSVKVDLTAGQVTVGFSGSPNENGVRKAIEEAGYEIRS